MAIRTRGRQEVSAGPDSGGGCALPPWQWEFRGGSVRFEAGVSQSIPLSGKLRRDQFGAFTELDFGVAACP